MDKKKKRKELSHLGLFRSLLSPFPEGRERITEKPDFIIDNGNHKTGIEVTSIFHNPSTNGKTRQAQESERHSLLDQALKQYKANGFPTVHASFHFAGETRLNKHNRLSYAKLVATLVASNVPQIGENRFLENEYDTPDSFPFEIHSIHIHRSDALESTFFNMPVAAWIQEDCAPIIQETLTSKENALRKYQQCDEHWLLIVAEWSATSSFFDPSDQTLSHGYSSSFHRAFFLNMFNRRLSELRIVGVRANRSLKVTEPRDARLR